MSVVLPFIISGIVTGGVYGLAATGLVLTYRTSGIFNFAQGAIAAAAAYVFYWLYVQEQLNWVLAALIALVLFGPIAGLVMERISRKLSYQRTAMKIVGTIGLILIVEGLTTIKWGSDSLNLPEFLPGGNSTFRLGGVNVTYAQLTVFIVSVLAVGALYWVLRATRLGLSMRAVVESPGLVSLHGTSPERVRAYAWIGGSTFAALSGVLIAPMVGVQSISLTFLVVSAFGAAAIGLFSNIPLTFAGALFLGIIASLSTKYVVNYSWLSGLPESLPFIALVIVLLVTPRRKLASQATEPRWTTLPWEGPALGKIAFGVALLVLLSAVPFWAGSHLPFFIVGLSQGILILSLGLLVRTAGIVSLCQTAFAATGAVAFSEFSVNLHLPWLIALILGSLVVVPIAALVALPAIRLSGLFLALATLGFGIMVQQMFYPMSFMFTLVATGREMPRPSFASTDRGYYYVVLAFLVFFGIVMYLIHRARMGRMLEGLSESPLSIRTLGLNTSALRITVLCLSGFMAGAAGILYGSTVHFASSGDSYYGPFYSLVILALLALSPMRAPWYAIFAVIGTVIPSYWNNLNATSWLNVLFGVSAVSVALSGGTVALPNTLQRAIESIFQRRDRKLQPARVTAPALTPNPNGAQDSRLEPREGLEVRELSVRYGGHIAVNNVSLKAPLGTITGLIGPNGAGKTSLFNACSGIIRPSGGRVVLHGDDVTTHGPAARGDRGLGRTFQVMQLCDSLSVQENVALGREAGQAGARPWNQIVSTPSQQRVTRDAVSEALELCGINSLSRQQAGNLSTGERRLVELARCLAGSFDVLLLDEPSSGLNSAETRRFAETLEKVVGLRGTGILLVEHDMSLVLTICSYVYVLDFGTLLFEGDPVSVRNSETVQRAYLGSGLIDDVPTSSDRVPT